MISVPSGGQEEAIERGRLVQMVKLQGKEIDALKVEVNMLRRKGGHVYSPAPPVPAPIER
jgi:ABC-type phosphate transport system ATPase subunit